VAFDIGWAFGASEASGLTIDEGLGTNDGDLCHHDCLEAFIADAIPAALLTVMENEGGFMS
jgi:hypothetical protein